MLFFSEKYFKTKPLQIFFGEKYFKTVIFAEYDSKLRFGEAKFVIHNRIHHSLFKIRRLFDSSHLILHRLTFIISELQLSRSIDFL